MHMISLKLQVHNNIYAYTYFFLSNFFNRTKYSPIYIILDYINTNHVLNLYRYLPTHFFAHARARFILN